MALPWFRVHIILINDPGRLISVHLIHNALVCGWAGSMTFFELMLFDHRELILNPAWRQGMLVIPFMNRLGVVKSWYGWGMVKEWSEPGIWGFEGVAAAHIILAGLFFLSAQWHWDFWDLEIFRENLGEVGAIDLPKVLGIHLVIASALCFGFGLFHLTGLWGPGMWTTDRFGLKGGLRKINPEWGSDGFNPFNYGGVAAHHIAAGLFGFVGGVFHLTIRPSIILYRALRMGNIESVLSSSIAADLFASFVVSGTMWYGSATTPVDLFGPTRYQWDGGYFQREIERRVEAAFEKNKNLHQAWLSIPDKLAFYDYIGNNPAKGGLFRAGPMFMGDGIADYWVGHLTFFDVKGDALSVRRMPTFFETFPILFLDEKGNLKSDIPFRRAEAKYSLEQKKLTCTIFGGRLDNTNLSEPALVKDYARKAQFGEIFSFQKIDECDGAFRTSTRGWFTYVHLFFGFVFFLGHLWHGGRVLFKEVQAGVGTEATDQVEFGAFEKLGDPTTKKRKGKL